MLPCSTAHPQVRPPLRGLLKVLASSHPGNALLNIQKHLIRWAIGLDGGGSSKAHVKPAKIVGNCQARMVMCGSAHAPSKVFESACTLQ